MSFCVTENVEENKPLVFFFHPRFNIKGYDVFVKLMDVFVELVCGIYSNKF